MDLESDPKSKNFYKYLNTITTELQIPQNIINIKWGSASKMQTQYIEASSYRDIAQMTKRT